MTRRRLSVALVVWALLGTPWADAAAQTNLGLIEKQQPNQACDVGR